MKLFILLLLITSNSFTQEIKVPKTLKKEYDSIDKISTYKSKKTAPYTFGDMWTPIQLLLKQKDNEQPYITMLIKWRDQRWIFADKAKLIFDDNQLDIKLPDRRTSVDAPNVNELYYIRLTDAQIELLREYLYAMGKKSSFSIRLYGQNGYVDIPGGLSVMGGLTKGMLKKNSAEMLEVMKFYDTLSEKLQ
ncbi:MAG: hypothetical protein ATN35_01640 [Epulopiscium sp. Nele67-Bin004]|nr:MAG: hypothetical protein ATN35_01640 [Epulopiscium sp. Nele67-Bin004]